MKKRGLCFLLSLVILLGLIPMTKLRVQAKSSYETSEACIALIKEFEGFIKYPVKDYKQYSVGYGTACGEDDYPNGITEEEADALLREHLKKEEVRINSFIDKYQVPVNQNKFDALMSFTYNFGSNWVNNESTFRKTVISGAMGNDFIFAITQWCSADGQILKSLVNRRLSEANVYLNGIYKREKPSNYTYVIFDNSNCTSEIRIQGYNADLTDTIRAVPTKSGHRFLGWYTMESSGKWVTELSAATAEATLYPYWQQGDGPKDASGAILGTAVSYQRYASATDKQAVRNIPAYTGTVMKTLELGQQVKIVADYVDANYIKWGKLEEGGWINLNATTSGVRPSDGSGDNGVVVTVISDYANVRSAPGAGNKLLGQVKAGDRLTIVKTQNLGDVKWGQIAGSGWVCLAFTNYESVILEFSFDPNDVTAEGVVSETDSLNIRSGPGTQYPIVGSLKRGDKVSITLQEKVGNSLWGRISSGWICLDYVALKNVEEEEDTENKVLRGVVVNTDQVNVRKYAGTENPIVAKLSRGTEVEILSTMTYRGAEWGQIDKGWVHMYYIEILGEVEDPENPTPEQPENPTEPGQPEEPEKPEEPIEGKMGIVVKTNALRVRSGAGTEYKQVGTLTMGTIVNIYETTTVKGAQWAKIDGGWVCMDYIELIASYDSVKKGVIVNTDRVNVRSSPGADKKLVTTLARGTEVEIYETTPYYGATWGRIKNGWVHMYYVDIMEADPAPETPENPGTPGTPETPETPEQPEPPEESETLYGMVVKTNSLRVRSGPGVEYTHVKSLVGGAIVKIYEITTVKGVQWAKIDGGWVCMDYIQLIGNTGVVKKGIVVNADKVNVRSAAGTDKALVCTLTRGTKVTVYETTVYCNATWGKIDQGWIHMYYVAITEEAELGGEDSSTDPTEEPNPTEEPKPSEDPKPEENPSLPEGAVSGVVINADELRIRKEAGTNHAVVGVLHRGDKVIILEQKVVSGMTWGRIDKGWISLNYVRLDSDDAGEGTLMTVIADYLRIRKGPGTDTEVVGSYYNGEKVRVLEITTDKDGRKWGRTNRGWVCMEYLK